MTKRTGLIGRLRRAVGRAAATLAGDGDSGGAPAHPMDAVDALALPRRPDLSGMRPERVGDDEGLARRGAGGSGVTALRGARIGRAGRRWRR
ncbi:MAG: hypothetical protein KDB39_12685 [Austwickia sp.]|nr:hypothetical protein [Austwickia sp.]